ncbi:TetR/AcrR family transcriptional regulator [Nocardiopsis sp. CC223A]|uniref:TetR/AcrR family transcriptional regulator n=1 Tax=Nocardiopsis sp. CC223A TaxID=3044051 RepID=UPI00278C4EEC|nr:TetR/AcrR family transcriptional regulator [Nocardiopsis sp. CC223A]
MAGRGRPKRPQLSRERVVTAAIALADDKGEAGVTMRAVAGRLGVEAMSLYNHVANREALLDGMVDAVFAEIDLPDPAADWRSAVRDRAASARAALRRHPWAVGLLDSRTDPGPATLRHHDTVLGILRSQGFSVTLAMRAVSVIDSYVYGFVMQELSLPFTDREGLAEVAGGILDGPLGRAHPHLAEVIAAQAGAGDYDPDEDFAFGLSLILGALHPDGGSAAAERGGGGGRR